MPDSRRKRRRLLQFSLRTVLVLLTAGCIWLGLKTEQVRRQRQLVRLVKNSGGELAYDYQYEQSPYQANTPPGPKLLRNVLGDDFFSKLVMVSLRGVSDTDVHYVAKQSTLRHLSIAGGVSDEALESVSQLKRLETLELYGGRFTGSGLDQLSKLRQLRRLTIADTGLSEESARSIGRLSQLEQLSLRNTRLGSKALRHFKGLSNLRTLDLSGTFVGDECLETLVQLNQLRILTLDGTMVTSQGLEKLHGALPNTEVSSMVIGRGFF